MEVDFRIPLGDSGLRNNQRFSDIIDDGRNIDNLPYERVEFSSEDFSVLYAEDGHPFATLEGRL